jgi:heme exporter protein B
MSKFLIIFGNQIKILYHHPKIFFSNILFFICFVVIFLIVLSPLQQSPETFLSNNKNSQTLLIGASFFAILACLLASTQDFLREDFADGTLEQMAINCENLEVFIIAKIFANWLNSCFVAVIFSTIIGALLGYQQDFLWQFFIVFLLTSLLINCICSLCGSLAILGGATSLIAFIALPLILPIIIFGCLGIYENFILNFKILIALNIFLNPILCFASTSIAKIALD